MSINPREVAYFSDNFMLKATTNGWYNFDCPFCDIGRHKQKCHVRYDWSRVKCWECDLSENIPGFVAAYEDVNYGTALRMLSAYKASSIVFDTTKLMVPVNRVTTISLPTGYTGLLRGKGAMGDKARAYCESRNFDIYELDRLGFGYCNEHHKEFKQNYFGYLIIPFKVKGKFSYYIGRDFMDSDYRYKNPEGYDKSLFLWNEDALDTFDEVHLTEGWSDALTIGPSGISSQGWKLSDTQLSKIINSKCKRITLVPDAGLATSGISYYALGLQLAADLIDIKQVRVVDLNGQSGKDVNAIGRDKFTPILNNTEWLNADNLYSKLIETW